MSYGTYLYPKIEDFSDFKDLTIEELREAIDGEVRLMTNLFIDLRTLSLCTPINTFGEQAFDKIKKLVSDIIDSYNNSYITHFNLVQVLDLKIQSESIKEGDTYEDGTPKRPCLFFNGATYVSKSEAEEAIEEYTKSIVREYTEILGVCMATPIDITPRHQEQYADGREEPILYINGEMNAHEEILNDSLRNLCIARLILTYWDGHEKG